LVGLAEPRSRCRASIRPIRSALRSDESIRLPIPISRRTSNPGRLLINAPRRAAAPAGDRRFDVADALANSFLAPKAGNAGTAAQAQPQSHPVWRVPSRRCQRRRRARRLRHVVPPPSPAPAATAAQFEDAVTVVTPPPFMAQLMPPQPSPQRRAAARARAPAAAAGATSRPSVAAAARWRRRAAPFAATALPRPDAACRRSAPPPRPRTSLRAWRSGEPGAGRGARAFGARRLYEPGGGRTPAWEAPPRQKSRGSGRDLVATVLIAGAGGGAYDTSRRLKAARAIEADTLNTQVDKLLKTGKPERSQGDRRRLTHSFELDSRSQRAAGSGCKTAC
jgi:hypothetical protein